MTGFGQLPIPGLDVEDSDSPLSSAPKPIKKIKRRITKPLTKKDLEKMTALLGAWSICGDLSQAKLVAGILTHRRS